MGYNLSNSPQGGNGWKHVQVFKHNDNWIVQVAYDFEANVAAMRAKVNGTWRPWTQMVSMSTLSQYSWQKLVLQNGWNHYTNYGDAFYTKSIDGIVYLKGNLWKGSTSSETTIAMLPEGFRPRSSMYLQALNNDYGNAILGVYPDGRLVVKSQVDNKWLNLDNISFRI